MLTGSIGHLSVHHIQDILRCNQYLCTNLRGRGGGGGCGQENEIITVATNCCFGEELKIVRKGKERKGVVTSSTLYITYAYAVR